MIGKEMVLDFLIVSAQQVCKLWNDDINKWLEHLDLSPFYHHVDNESIAGLLKFPNLKRLNLARCQVRSSLDLD